MQLFFYNNLNKIKKPLHFTVTVKTKIDYESLNILNNVELHVSIIIYFSRNMNPFVIVLIY